MLGRLVRPPQLTSLTTSLLSSQTCKRLTTKPSPFSASEPDKPSATSEFLKSFGVLLEEPQRGGIVGRWDWHLWQVFVMLLPPLGVAALAYFANIDMKKQEALLLIQKEQQQEEELAAQLAEPPQPSASTSEAENGKASHAEVQAKLQALEDAIKLMQVRQLIQDMTDRARIPLVGPVQDQAMQSTKAWREGQSEAAKPHTPTSDLNPTPVEKQTQMLPEESRPHSVTQQQAEQTHGTSAQRDANAITQPSVDIHEPMSDFVPHPTAVDTVRQYAKKQFRWLLNGIQHSFTRSNNSDNSSSQHEQEEKQKETD